MSDDVARNTCRLLRWIEEMNAVIAMCERSPADHECARMARVLREHRDYEIERSGVAHLSTTKIGVGQLANAA